MLLETYSNSITYNLSRTAKLDDSKKVVNHSSLQLCAGLYGFSAWVAECTDRSPPTDCGFCEAVPWIVIRSGHANAATAMIKGIVTASLLNPA
jgi:hypothetical protein